MAGARDRAPSNPAEDCVYPNHHTCAARDRHSGTFSSETPRLVAPDAARKPAHPGNSGRMLRE